jgi:Tfp pilus assembly major pilin PilA
MSEYKSDARVADKTTVELLEELYRGVKMGSEALLTMLPKVKNDALRDEMTEELADYEEYASRAAAMLAERGEKAKEENWVTKWMAQMGITMQTLTDTTTSHLAEQLVQGSTMGTTDLLSALHRAEREGGADPEAVTLAREVLSYEERSRDRVKRFL